MYTLLPSCIKLYRCRSKAQLQDGIPKLILSTWLTYLCISIMISHLYRGIKLREYRLGIINIRTRYLSTFVCTHILINIRVHLELKYLWSKQQTSCCVTGHVHCQLVSTHCFAIFGMIFLYRMFYCDSLQASHGLYMKK